MERLFGGDVNSNSSDNDDDNEDEAFMYAAEDSAETSGFAYRDRLRDVLGSDHDAEEDEDVHEVEHSLIIPPHPPPLDDDDEPLDHNINSDHAPSLPSPSVSSGDNLTPPRAVSPGMIGSPSRLLAKPFLHPNVSRLRSYTPGSRPVSSASNGTLSSHFDDTSLSPSHFSAMSRVSSVSNLHTPSSSEAQIYSRGAAGDVVFRWTPLRNITHHLY
ncbi:hypothetical protein GGX14DRAFT_581631 [Mycena pura]|uniref:Uncharacterized protein n=1 Tax=Mycena pura TaxID=153505 RepID=A0AAD6YUK6_9AGAR|nr:hypothetical protein GGX14DRAFT_581631 [Mycena pura]